MTKRDFLKGGVASALTCAIGSSRAFAAAKADRIGIRWLGGATMELKIGPLRFLTDPCLADRGETFLLGPQIARQSRLTDFPGLTEERYDAVLLSHAHADHFDEAARTWLGKRAPLICPPHDHEALASAGFDAKPLAHGETRRFERDDTIVDVTAIPAVHSRNKVVADYLGAGSGYFIQARTGAVARDLYWAGDTFLTHEVVAALEQFPNPDLFIPHVGGVELDGGTAQVSFTGRDALAAAHRIGAARMLPIHHTTFSHYREPIQALIDAHAEVPDIVALTVLAEGATFELE